MRRRLPALLALLVVIAALVVGGLTIGGAFSSAPIPCSPITRRRSSCSLPINS